MELAITRLSYLVQHLPAVLSTIGEEVFSFKPIPTQWSKKEILGHLIDSATNNHHRLVRSQFEEVPEISYNQNLWNEFNYYQQIPSEHLILLWTTYNKHLIEILKRTPPKNFKKEVKIGENICNLEFLVTDYVEHLEHHLKQIVDY